jgi:hypothetical protein
MAIMEAVRAIDDKLVYQFVSYGTGALTLSEFGYSVVDLGLPDDNPFFETLIRSSDAIRRLSPHIILCHEEFAAVFAAKALGVPVIWLCDWFGNERDLGMQALGHVESIIFMGDPGVFDEPPYLTGKVRYFSSIVRDFKYHRQDRLRARQELGIADNVLTVSVIPGSWANEQRAPVFDLLTSAFLRLEREQKLLCWVAGSDYSALQERTKGMCDVRILKAHWPTEQLIVASDLVVTKGNRGSIMEISELGVPSISLSYGQNPIDDIIVARIKSNLPLRIKGITPDYLARCMDIVHRLTKAEDESQHRSTGLASVAQALVGAIRKAGP